MHPEAHPRRVLRKYLLFDVHYVEVFCGRPLGGSAAV